MTMTTLALGGVMGVLLLISMIGRGRCQNLLLCLANFIFCYLAGGVRTLLFLGCAALLVYAGAILAEKQKSTAFRRMILAVVLGCNLLVLLLTKYLTFFSPKLHPFAAPLGVSFYTMQLLGYFLDVYMEKIEAEKDLLNYLTFASYFPQLTSGPISRYEQLGRQLQKPRALRYRNVTFGAQRILWGLFKKLVLSERLGILVTAIYAQPEVYCGAYIPMATVFFALELYTDFSGYMDIANGISECMGITLPENFERPFFARSVSEYWRKWHITLGEWFKDYLYYPLLKTRLFVRIGKKSREKLGKKRGKMLPVHLALILLWFSVGFWHGGAWKYIIGSGLLHCFYIVGGQLCSPVFERIRKMFSVRTECFSYRLFERIRTFALICLGFLFFRASDTGAALGMLKEMLRPDLRVFSLSGLCALGTDEKDLFVLGIGLLLLLIVSCVQEAKGSVREILAGQNLPFRWLVYLLLLYAVLIFGMYGPGFATNQFIYQNF